MWRKRLSLVFLIVAWFAIGWLARGLIAPPLNSELQLVAQAGDVLSAKAYGPLPAVRAMTYAAIRGLLDSLNDKYAVFFDPQAAEHDALGLQGQDAVIGLRGELRSGQFVVIDIFPDQPAAQAGLHVGDSILEVDGWPITDTAFQSEVVSMIRGPIGSVAHLTIRRDNRTLKFDVPRQPAHDVTTHLIDGHIGYIRLDRFTDQSPRQMEDGLKALLASNPTGLIWDLRYNGGGLMDATQKTLDLFLPDGLAFYAKTSDGKLISYPTVTGNLAEQIPLVVLIGPDTYSAPETAAAAIADRGRGQLIGQTTHGKGSIVDTVKLIDGSALRFTVARWLSPVHQTDFEGRGVTPDVVVDENSQGATEDGVLQRAVAVLQ